MLKKDEICYTVSLPYLPYLMHIYIYIVVEPYNPSFSQTPTLIWTNFGTCIAWFWSHLGAAETNCEHNSQIFEADKVNLLPNSLFAHSADTVQH